ncbi:hypothetical protein K701_14115 [Streptomyces fradiae ATCC 10745 = DSM 40063]|uniref:Uncharacterized protein n=1 Tax=Streptomyces fradiae ATCC 10745 = DSM 40063 TaxID=1319510 RepID=A0ABQ6XU14_STRFR|nr:hypothetical protein K701_14115 [Streptomyces fradiae ATCC 10745 = DSM 40063]
MAEEPMTDILLVVEVSISAVEAVDADVVKETSGSDEISIDVCVVPGIEELLRNAPDDLTVTVDGFERFE